MRFTWIGALLAPLLVPLLLSAAMVGLFGSNNPAMVFVVMVIAGCFVSYGTMFFLFLPALFLLSLWARLTTFRVCLLGLLLGALAFVPMTLMEWKSSGPDSGPPTESFFSFFLRWFADPLTAVYPLAGFATAGLYWWLGTWWLRRGASRLPSPQ
jgi:hypothetical protein